MKSVPATVAGAVLVALTLAPANATPPSVDAAAHLPAAKTASAQEPLFKRVRPPRGNPRQRITIQIGREDAAPPATQSVRRQRYPWFWETVSPARADADPERLDAALAAIDAAGGLGTPVALLQEIVEAHAAPITEAADAHGISEALILAVIAVESRGATRAISPAGAQGLMQLMPATARRFGVADSFDAAANIDGGVRYLDWLLEHFEADPVLALAGYNAGEGAVLNAEGVPNYTETRDYVPKVLDAWRVARALCPEPPADVRDRCALPVRITAPG